MCVYVHVCESDYGRDWIAWNWSYRKLFSSPMWVLKTKLHLKDQQALNYWAISPVQNRQASHAAVESLIAIHEDIYEYFNFLGCSINYHFSIQQESLIFIPHYSYYNLIIMKLLWTTYMFNIANNINTFWSHKVPPCLLFWLLAVCTSNKSLQKEIYPREGCKSSLRALIQIKFQSHSF